LVRIAVGVVLAFAQLGCRQLLDLDPPTQRVDDASPAADARADATAGPDALTYHATAVQFSTATNDYLTTNALDHATNSPRGTASYWVRFTGGDANQQLIVVAAVEVANVGVAGGIYRTADDHLGFLMFDCAGGKLLDMKSNSTYTMASGWVHVLAAWDVSAGLAQLYDNGAPDLAPGPTINNGSICYTAWKWGVGGLSSGSLDAGLADVYASLGTFVDLGSAANRQLFEDTAHKPVDLGASCETPEHSTPTLCFTGSATTWNMNKGSGDGFTVEGGTLAPAATSPSD
jgi:hypothetical protein